MRRALSVVHMALYIIYREFSHNTQGSFQNIQGFSRINRAPFIIRRALFIEYRVLFRICRAFLIGYRTLSSYTGLFSQD